MSESKVKPVIGILSRKIYLKIGVNKVLVIVGCERAYQNYIAKHVFCNSCYCN